MDALLVLMMAEKAAPYARAAGADAQCLRMLVEAGAQIKMP